MREAMPNGCFIGFTGTPLAKKERNTFLRFGALVKPAYTLAHAVREKSVLPLLYEGRMVEQEVNEAGIDAWFERETRDLTDKQKADLKRKMSRASTLTGVSDWLRCVAFDVGRHFTGVDFKPDGLKGQVVVSSKRDAVLIQRLFAELDEVKTEVIISPPDMREGDKDVDEENDSDVNTFWKRMMTLYGDETAYSRRIIDAFKGAGGPDLLIVVNKLLTGFDAPRNTVLYMARPLKEHTLLQAIARVNRVFDEEGAADKDYGYIIDYCGVLKDLDKALSGNSALEAFDEKDLALTVQSMRATAAQLPNLHAELLALFAGVSDSFDEEAYARMLEDEALRAEFYEKLSRYRLALSVAQASHDFVEATPDERLRRWRADAMRFENLRAHVRSRYAERIDWADYRGKVQKLLDRHVTAHDVSVVIEPLDVFDDKRLDKQRKEQKRSDASVADEIAHHTLRQIDEKWEEDPVLYERFSKLVKDTIAAFRQHRLDEKAYLAEVKRLRDGVTLRSDESDPVPAEIRGLGHETAFWGIARRELQTAGIEDEGLAVKLGVAFAEIIGRCRTVGWQDDKDAENRMRRSIDDFYYDALGAPEALSTELLDRIVADVLTTARTRMPDDGRAR